EVGVLNPRILDRGVHDLLDTLPDPVAPRLDNHAAAHARFLGEVGLGNDILIPGREVGLTVYAERMLDHLSCFCAGGREEPRIISFWRVRPEARRFRP